MIHKMFTIYDTKSEMYLPPFYVRVAAEAIRSVRDAAAQPGHQFQKYPAEFALFEVGEYDDLTCTVIMLPAPVRLGLVQDFVN